MVDPRDHRIGDAERQQVVDLLRSHTGAGRLTLDEFGDLAARVYAAQTYRELEAIARDLPPGLVPEPPAPGGGPIPPGFGVGPAPTPASAPAPGTAPGVPGVPGGQAPERRARRRFIAVMSGSHARGNWRVPRHITAFAFWGGVVIDLRDAAFDEPVVDITAWAIMGGVTVIVGEQQAIEADGLVLMGGVNHPRSSQAPPGAPLARVHARGLWGGVNAIVKRPSRWSRSRRDRLDGRDRSSDRSDRRDEHRDERRAVHAERREHRSRRRGGWPGGTEVGEARSDRHDDWIGPFGPLPALELPQPVLDGLAQALSRLRGPEGAPLGVQVPRRNPSARRADRHDGPPSSGHDGPADREGTPAVPTGTLTMLVTDIVDSTTLAERLGDRRWIEVLGEHYALVREQVAQHGGVEVKAQGDGFLVVFRSARQAILAAVEVQRALARYRDSHPDTPVEVRVGLHTGEIVDVDGDVFGQNVVIAVRIAGHAAPGEVVVSGLTRDLTVSGGDLSFGPADEVELKGLSERWRIHRVAWSRAPA